MEKQLEWLSDKSSVSTTLTVVFSFQAIHSATHLNDPCVVSIMAPKKDVKPKTYEQVDVSEEDEEEIARLFEMLAMEDVQDKLAGSSNDMLQGYMSAVEKKVKNYLNAYQQVKDAYNTREKERKAVERKQKAAEDRVTKKEEEAARRLRPITINIRFGLGGQVLTLTVPVTTTLGEFRRLIIAHYNTLNPMSKIPKGKAKDLHIFKNEKSLHISPRKILEHLLIENNDTLVALMAGDVPASSSQTMADEVASTINEEEEEEEESDDENVDEEQ